ncbi:MAG: T9SS type A sorting domain-containing protein, partial [Fibrobacter sp.]|nr:T9SS type A sorting domain-containing protein [Fibrobacter sp.]
VTLQITDLMGNLVESVDVKTYASIDLGHLPRGIYLVRIAGDSLKKASRIMIK